jgi:hypothetical protein
MNTIEIELTETTATLPKELLLEILEENERLKEELEIRIFYQGQNAENLRALRELQADVPQLQAKIAELKNWKSEASKILDDLKLQEVGKELGLTVGTDIAPHILPGIQKLKNRLEKTRRYASEIGEYYGQAVDTLRRVAIYDECDLAELAASLMTDLAAVRYERDDLKKSIKP